MNQSQRILMLAGIACLLWLGTPKASPGTGEARAARIVAGSGQIGLPRAMPDAQGNNWTVYPGGWLQIQGNMPVYGQGAVLSINGAQPSSRNNQATLDPKTGELVLENLSANNVQITRRIKTNADGGYVRYVDVLTNPAKAELAVQVGLQTTLNFGVQSSATVQDPRNKNQNIGWVAMTHGNRAAAELYAGKGAKLAPTIESPENSNMVRAVFDVKIPAGRSIALMHLHATAGSAQAAQDLLLKIKDRDLLKDLPTELRKQLVNFSSGQAFIGDLEVLRGDLLDVVELRSGDQVRGTIEQPGYELHTFYGTIQLPVERVVALINLGEFRPRQLLVTTDGEVFGGSLSTDTISLRLSSGQVTRIPLGQVSRMGYRKRSGEPEEWSTDRPMVLLRSGDRVGIVAPNQPIPFATRYGTLQVAPASIAAIVFASPDQAVHQLWLLDGSHVAGLATGAGFAFRLSGTPSAEPVTFPASAIATLVLGAKVEEPDKDAATVELANDDLLVGSLVGQIKLNTSFDTLEIDAREIRALSHLEASPLDVKVTLWDNTTVSGQVDAPQVTCQLSSGLTVDLPVGLIRAYNQPLPSPSAPTVQRIGELVKQLGDDDWKVREQAETQLVSMGVAVIGVLQQARADQSPEAQQRIDTIIRKIQEGRSAGQ